MVSWIMDNWPSLSVEIWIRGHHGQLNYGQEATICTNRNLDISLFVRFGASMMPLRICCTKRRASMESRWVLPGFSPSQVPDWLESGSGNLTRIFLIFCNAAPVALLFLSSCTFFWPALVFFPGQLNLCFWTVLPPFWPAVPFLAICTFFLARCAFYLATCTFLSVTRRSSFGKLFLFSGQLNLFFGQVYLLSG